MRDVSLFFFNDTATTEIYTLSLHDALPIFGLYLKMPNISAMAVSAFSPPDSSITLCNRLPGGCATMSMPLSSGSDRKSTRLNSSHGYISYAVFCLKKKTKIHPHVGPSCAPS